MQVVLLSVIKINISSMGNRNGRVLGAMHRRVLLFAPQGAPLGACACLPLLGALHCGFAQTLMVGHSDTFQSVLFYTIRPCRIPSLLDTEDMCSALSLLAPVSSLPHGSTTQQYHAEKSSGRT